MKLFNFLKRNKEEIRKPILSREHRLTKENAIRQHENRINNISEEFEVLSNKLEGIEGDFNIPQSSKAKESDSIIRKMSLIKYEIEIREGLVKWLS